MSFHSLQRNSQLIQHSEEYRLQTNDAKSVFISHGAKCKDTSKQADNTGRARDGTGF